MRKIIVLVVLCALAVGLGSVNAMAYSSYARATGKDCGFCHVDPGGGGPLTDAGQYYKDNGVLPPEPPIAPTALTATAVSDTQIDLAWTDASSDETGFKIEAAPSASGTFSLVADLPAGTTTYSHTGLTASTAYYYRVYAYNTVGDSAFSNVASATTQTPAPTPTPPAAPTGLNASAVSTTQIDLSWTDASDNETGFKVERGSSASGPFSEIASLAAGATTHSDTGLTESTTYYYRVYAVNADGNSGYSDVASATTQTPAPTPTPPAVPTGLTASAVSTTQIDLSWTDASDNETGFKVERGSSASGPFTEIASLAAGATTHSDTGLTESTTYYYRVYAVNADGNSGYSNVASATTQTPAPTPTPPAAPTGLGASTISTSQINLAWTDASDNETGFKVERGSSASGPFSEIASLAAGATTHSDTGLTESTTYYYRVYAVNGDGSSDYSNVASATTDAGAPTPTPTPPAAPTGLGASAVSSSQINLAWTDASDNETGFKVERGSSASGPFTEIASLAAGATSYSDTGLTESTTYYYRVYAVNADGSSDFSNVANATTQAVTPPPPSGDVPAAPSDLAAAVASRRQINLTWTDNSNNETGFRVWRSNKPSGRYKIIATLGADVTSYTDNIRGDRKKYYYRVMAFNAAGAAVSNTAEVKLGKRGGGDDDDDDEDDDDHDDDHDRRGGGDDDDDD